MTALTTTYKVAVARLQADGVGPLAPVASNDGEAGRAKNRRVCIRAFAEMRPTAGTCARIVTY